MAFTAGGEVRAASPFSPTPTPARVCWAGGPPAHAMCAIDALGCPPCPATITATEPGTGRAITVQAHGDRARWRPRTTVVFAGTASGAGGPAADHCCAHINFFTTARAARAWARRHPEITGHVLGC